MLYTYMQTFDVTGNLEISGTKHDLYILGSTCQVDQDKHNDERRPRVTKPTNIQASHTRLMKLFIKRAAHRRYSYSSTM
jgi:hypothetical protein